MRIAGYVKEVKINLDFSIQDAQLLRKLAKAHWDFGIRSYADGPLLKIAEKAAFNDGSSVYLATVGFVDSMILLCENRKDLDSEENETANQIVRVLQFAKLRATAPLGTA